MTQTSTATATQPERPALGPDLDAQLERLDGLHRPAATATLPTGGEV